MKLSIIGDVEEGKEGCRLRIIDTFVQDMKGGGTPILLSSGSSRLMNLVTKYAREKEYPSLVMYDSTQLSVVNADKVLVLKTKSRDMEEVVAMCKKYDKPYMGVI